MLHIRFRVLLGPHVLKRAKKYFHFENAGHTEAVSSRNWFCGMD